MFEKSWTIRNLLWLETIETKYHIYNDYRPYFYY